MSETIGRVDFLVSLDGNKLPAQAKALGKKIGEAGGKQAGESFGDEFENTFDKRLSLVGKEFAVDLGNQGKLAGRSFSDELSDQVTARFRTLQRDLADVLSDTDSFRRYADGFGSIGEAVDQLSIDLGRLSEEIYTFQDEAGETVDELVLTEEQMKRLTGEARRMGDEYQIVIDRERKLAAETDLLRRQTAELEGQYRRLTASLGDVDSFSRLADELGGTEQAYRRLHREISETGFVLGKTNGDIGIHLDRLDRTRIAADRAAERLGGLNVELEGSIEPTRRAGDAFDALGRKLTNSHGFRQAAFWTGLIASSAEHIAVLGSAAGAGLLVLGGSLSQLVVAGGALVPIFTHLKEDLEKLPPEMRAVAGEFDRFKGSFNELADVIASNAFAEMDGTFARLEGTVSALGPSFGVVGKAAGKLFDDFSKNVAPGTAMFKEIEKLVLNSADALDSMGRTAGTFGGAFVRAFNRGNPLIQTFYGWLDKLANRFDDFTRGPGFDVWMENATRTFGAIGPLLDATGRALNDLVTPDTVQRTVSFLDSLTNFMPDLSRLLNMIGGLDIFGLAAQMLEEFGAALRPLAEPMTAFAEQLNRIGGDVITGVATGVGALATAAAPLVSILAGILSAVPDEALIGLATAATIAAGAFGVLRGASGILGAVESLGIFGSSLTVAKGRIDGFAGTLKGLGGKAGLIGLVGVGAWVAAEGITDMLDSLYGLEGAARNAVAGSKSLNDSMKDISIGSGGLTADVDKVVESLDGLDNFLNYIVKGASFLDIDVQARDLAATLKKLDEPISKLASTDLTAATEQFRNYVEELGGTDEAARVALENMPLLRAELESVAIASGRVASETDLVNMAMGRGSRSAQDISRDILLVGENSQLTAQEVQNLADKVEGFGNRNLDARAAARDFQDSLADLTQGIIENGTILDISTEQGRANEQSIDDLAKATMRWSDSVLQQTGSQEQANAITSEGRARLLELLEQFGITGEEAEAYADKLGLIPINADTTARLFGADEVEQRLNELSRDRSMTIRVTSTGGVMIGDREITPYASGGIADKPHFGVFGEAGREALVPLDRPLAQVDPSVRALSAIAQGKAPAPTVSMRPSVTFEAGAIVVQEAADARRTAIDVMNEVAELISG